MPEQVLMDATLSQILATLFAKDMALSQKDREIAALRTRVAELEAQVTAHEATAPAV